MICSAQKISRHSETFARGDSQHSDSHTVRIRDKFKEVVEFVDHSLHVVYNLCSPANAILVLNVTTGINGEKLQEKDNGMIIVTDDIDLMIINAKVV